MHDAAAAKAPNRKLSFRSLTRLRAGFPTLAEASLVTGSALLLVLSFPDFDLWWLAWIGQAPLLIAVVRTPKTGRAFLLGLLWGTIFFYGTCWWLTHPMIHYGHLPPWLAYVLLLPAVVFVALFPAVTCALVARAIGRFGPVAVFAAPFIWVATDWARYEITGLMWNAVGYSQAFHPFLIHSARWGGVYAVSFLILMANVAMAFALLRRMILQVAASVGVLTLISVALAGTHLQAITETEFSDTPQNLIVAVQPNVPMDGRPDDPASEKLLLNLHLELSEQGLREPHRPELPRLVIWPESPMSFSYSRDPQLQATLGTLAQRNRTSVLLNSLEPAPNGGSYNSAVLINEEGRIVAQYDKIRLMPFGEYVPLPRWLPGASSVRAIVGEFTPGSSYTLMPLGDLRAGVFICVEAAHPGIASTFTTKGADVLINISNDGYLGPTPVMRQHLANAIFRAVENGRPLVRVTNSGISAAIDSKGRVWDPTPPFQSDLRIWWVGKQDGNMTFYARHGDIFAYLCILVALGTIAASFIGRRRLKRS